MPPYSRSKNKETSFDTPNSVEGYPKDSFKEMAVLFTDIVGSSRFFQAQGDIAGRRMLKEHQELVSPLITEHGGVVVKMLGDSVMAYFLNAREALKSAINIQKRFKYYNKGKATGDQIHIRLCVHFGEGIVEEEDIFGDVVNMAAKFLPFVQGDQIVISDQVHTRTQNLPSIRFEPFAIPENNVLPKGFRLIQVLWEESIRFDPLMKTLVYIKPLFNLGKSNFLKTWNSLLAIKNSLWQGHIEKEAILEDKTVVLIVREAAFSLTLAKRVHEFLKINLGQEAIPFVPTQILIDAGSYLRAGRVVLDDLVVNWKDIEPGEVYISTTAHGHIKQTANISVQPEPAPNQPRSFFKITMGNEQKEESRLFRYQNALIQGEYAPCFYCGDRRHATTSCPSKGLTEITLGLSHLGYLSVEEINNHFFTYLNGSRSNPDQFLKQHPGTANPALWAFQGFYELKLVFQLRFFRALWNSNEENWNRIKERPLVRDEGDQSGLLWIGQDCIRVSNLEQAQSILVDCLNKDPQDYRVYCALAILYIERNDFLQAKYYLKKALDRTKTTPQRIFIHFLLSRLYDLSDDRTRAEEMNRKILYLNPYCYEAIYQDILFEIKKGKEVVALNKLMKLIRKNREFYLHALIDPELANYSGMIHQRLKELLDEAKGKAREMRERAKAARDRIVKWLDEEDNEVVEANSRWQKIEELSKGTGYFGYLDIIHFSETIVNIGQRGIETRKKQLGTNLMELRSQAEQIMTYINGFQYAFLIRTVKQELQQLQRQLDAAWDVDEPKVAGKFKEAFEAVKRLAIRLEEIRLRLKRLDRVRRGLLFIAGFFKKSLIFQSANLILALILFPILAYYLNFLVPVFDITSQSIWTCQKAVLIFGGVSGLLFAIVSATKNL